MWTQKRTNKVSYTKNGLVALFKLTNGRMYVSINHPLKLHVSRYKFESKEKKPLFTLLSAHLA